jgi:uncharacterized repeat protein (TIGR01451 family)
VTSDTAEVIVNCSDLTVTKTAASDAINAGDDASFTITVTNNGTGTAFGVTATDNLPVGVVWTASDVTGVDANCVITGEPGNQVLTCGPVDMTGGQTFSVTVSGPTDPSNCGVITNTVVVTTGKAPIEAADAVEVDEPLTATAEMMVNCPDVTIDKSGNGPIMAGGNAIFTIKVSNMGTGVAKNVKVTDKLPAGLDWSLVDDVDGCAITDGTLVCEFDTLAPGETITITVSAPTTAGVCSSLNTNLVNTAQVSADNEPSGKTTNNSDSATIVIKCGAVEITKIVCTTSTKTPVKIDVSEPEDVRATGAKPERCKPGDGY